MVDLTLNKGQILSCSRVVNHTISIFPSLISSHFQSSFDTPTPPPPFPDQWDRPLPDPRIIWISNAIRSLQIFTRFFCQNGQNPDFSALNIWILIQESHFNFKEDSGSCGLGNKASLVPPITDEENVNVFVHVFGKHLPRKCVDLNSLPCLQLLQNTQCHFHPPPSTVSYLNVWR